MSYTPPNPNGQATMANSSPVVIASDQSPLNTIEAALMVTGQASQTAVVNNILTTTAGTAATDLQNYRTATVQVVSTGTGGTFIFEQSNDNVNFVALPVFNAALVTGVPITAAITATASQIIYTFPVRARYVRLRIATTITGGSIQAHSRFSTEPWTAAAQLVASNTAANMQVTSTMASTTLTAVTPGTAAANLGKARDGVAGATDTGVAVLAIRRDTPTAVTSAAGDYEPPQISANGETWVRSIGEVADDAAVTLGTQRAIMNGGVAVSMDGTDPLAVSAEGDAAVFRTDPNRILLINQTHPRFFRAAVDYAAAQTNTSVVAAPGAGLSLYITDIVISNGATAGNITLLDGSGGSLLFELYPAANGGVAHSFRNPIKLTANTALVTTSTTVTTHAITVTGYIAA